MVERKHMRKLTCCAGVYLDLSEWVMLSRNKVQRGCERVVAHSSFVDCAKMVSL